MEICFLDKKLVGDIRNHLTMRTSQGVDIARSIDETPYTASALLALFTEKLLRAQRTQEMLDTVLADAKLLDKFYKKAPTDAQFLLAHKFNLVAPFCNNAERRLQECIAFIWFLQMKLSEQPQPEVTDDLSAEVLAMAEMHHVEPGNPLVITALASVYGHADARHIIRKDAAKLSDNNPLSEAQIDMINLFLMPDAVSSYAKQLWTGADIPQEIAFTLLTPNVSFNAFADALGMHAYPVASAEQGEFECEFGMDLTADFFPDIANDPQRLSALVQRLTSGGVTSEGNETET